MTRVNVKHGETWQILFSKHDSNSSYNNT